MKKEQDGGEEEKKKNLIRRAHKNGGAPWLLSWKNNDLGFACGCFSPAKAPRKTAPKRFFSPEKGLGSTPVGV